MNKKKFEKELEVIFDTNLTPLFPFVSEYFLQYAVATVRIIHKTFTGRD